MQVEGPGERRTRALAVTVLSQRAQLPAGPRGRRTAAATRRAHEFVL